MTSTSRPSTPTSYLASLTARARNRSGTAGTPVGELIELYYHRRLLARVFQTQPDGWVLKGGQALLVRWPTARYSRDVDLLRIDDGGVDKAVAALLAAAAVPLDDSLGFVHHDTSVELTTGRPTRKVRFKVMFGLRQLAMASVDVVTAEAEPCGSFTIERLEAPFDTRCGPWPGVRMWPLEDHVADKIAAMYERHRAAGLPSTRYKDLVDLVLIALNSELSGPVTHTALHAEVERRRRAGTRLELPPTFTVPDASWVRGYRAQARELPPG